MRMHRTAGLLVFAIAIPLARADGGGGDVELSAFRPAVDSRGFITIDGADSLEPGQLSLGLVSTWARGLLRLDGDGGASYRVDDVVVPTLIAAVGLPGGLEVAASLPFGVVAGDRGPDDDAGTPTNPYDDDRRELAEQGLGDLGLSAKLELWRTGALRGALVGTATLPTAARAAWLGTGGVSLSARGVIEARRGRWRGALNGGLRASPRGDQVFRDTPPMDDPTMPTTNAEIVVGPAALAGGAVAWSASAKLELVGEVFAVLPLRGDGYRPIEALAGAKLYLAERSYLSLGAGAGLAGDGGNPDARVFVGMVFEPRSPATARTIVPDEEIPPPARGVGDRDGDGLLDSLDGCPDAPEDFDEFEDDDGCPDTDNDGDRIADRDDLCENEAEDFDEVEDDDGCPETDADRDRIADNDDECPTVPENWNTYKDDDGCDDRSIVNVGVTAIDVLDEIHFEFDSAVIQRRSHRLLSIIARTIQLNPGLLKIEVGGHTDERGSDEYNDKLSRARARAVREHLIETGGVAAERLSAEGYGERRPKIDRSNERAWRANRRVEFVIVDRE